MPDCLPLGECLSRISGRQDVENLEGSSQVQDGDPRSGSIASPTTPLQDSELQSLGRSAPSASLGPIQQVTADNSSPLPPLESQQLETTSTQRDGFKELWCKALGQLSKFEKDQNVIDHAKEVARKIGSLDEQSSKAKDLANNIKRQMEDQIEAQSHNGSLRGFLEQTASVLNKFVSVGDIAVSFDPVHAALPWAAVRFVLVNLTAWSDLKNKFLSGFASVISLVLQCQTYLSLYNTINPQLQRPKAAGDALETSIIRAYIQTLLFLGFTMHCQNRWTRIINAPFRLGDMDGYIKRLVESGRELDQAANNYEKHFSHQTRSRIKELLGLTNELHVVVQKHLDVINQVKTELHSISQKLVMDQLTQRIAEQAAFDSVGEEHSPVCLPGTRVELLRHIMQWAGNCNPQAEIVFWLNGMAGTGKSTISRTIARYFAEMGYLGASFFFKRTEFDQSTISKFVTTIVAQLIERVPAITAHVKHAIDTNPNILMKTTEEKFKTLILDPLSKIPPDTRTVVVLVVDALDECDNEKDIELLIRLFAFAKTVKSTQFRVFVTSRPELHIRLRFARDDVKDIYQTLILHNIPEDIIKRDLTQFLEYELNRIKTDYNISLTEGSPLPSEWPGRDKIQTLVAMATPLFIFATTLCRFLREINPIQLDNVLNYKETNELSYGLNAIYMPVLDRQLNIAFEGKKKKALQEFHDIVGPIVVLASPLSKSALASLLDIPLDTISSRLGHLHSVLIVPKTSKEPIRLFHLSFRDFLLSTGGKRHAFSMDEKEIHKRLATQCLRIMRKSLRKNICGVHVPGMPLSSIEPQRIQDNIPPELAYACQFWVEHMQRGEILDYVEVNDFLHQYFLHWLEVMCLSGDAINGLVIVHQLQSIVQTASDKLYEFLSDATRFIFSNLGTICHAPLQIYSSALVFAPNNSIIPTVFKKEIEDWVSLWSQGGRTELRLLKDNFYIRLLGYIDKVTISPDAKYVASVLTHGTIQIWSAETGECQHTLVGHHRSLRMLTFSPDGSTVASCSSTGVIKLWSTETGECKQTLKDPTGIAYSVSFSPDGKALASCSDEPKIRFWSVRTGALQQTLEIPYSLEDNQRTGWDGFAISSVVFSPKGKFMASESSGSRVHVWSAKTNTSQNELLSYAVMSVISLSGGKLVASSLDCNEIEICSIEEGCALVDAIFSHRGSYSYPRLSFTQDNQYLLTRNGVIPIERLLQPALVADTHIQTPPSTSDFQSLLDLNQDCRVRHEVINGEYITVNGKPFLLIPPEHSPRMLDIVGPTVVILNGSWGMVILRFSTELPRSTDTSL